MKELEDFELEYYMEKLKPLHDMLLNCPGVEEEFKHHYGLNPLISLIDGIDNSVTKQFPNFYCIDYDVLFASFSDDIMEQILDKYNKLNPDGSKEILRRRDIARKHLYQETDSNHPELITDEDKENYLTDLLDSNDENAIDDFMDVLKSIDSDVIKTSYLNNLSQKYSHMFAPVIASFKNDSLKMSWLIEDNYMKYLTSTDTSHATKDFLQIVESFNSDELKLFALGLSDRLKDLSPEGEKTSALQERAIKVARLNKELESLENAQQPSDSLTTLGDDSRS